MPFEGDKTNKEPMHSQLFGMLRLKNKEWNLFMMESSLFGSTSLVEVRLIFIIAVGLVLFEVSH